MPEGSEDDPQGPRDEPISDSTLTLKASDDASRMAELLDRAPIGLAEVSSDGTIVTGNHLARALLAQTELAGCTLEDFIHPDAITTWQTLWRRFLAGEDVQGETLQVQLSPQRTRFLRFTFDRQAGRRYLWLDDRSEQRALTTQLTRDAAPERSLLHELNNALTTGVGFVDVIEHLLKERTQLSGESLVALREHLALVRRSLDETDALLNESRRTRRTPHVPASDSISVDLDVEPRHLLVVDDEPAILELLDELFGERRYRVSSFSNAARALRFFADEAPSIDVAIIDHVMPGVSGIGLASEMLAIRADLPIILCSNDPGIIAEQAAGRMQVQHLLEKPIDLSRLRRMVERIVESAEAISPNA